MKTFDQWFETELAKLIIERKPNDRELLRSVWLAAIDEELNAIRARIEFRQQLIEAQSLISDLKSELAKERETVDFYSSKDHWHPFRSFADEWGAIDDSDWTYCYDKDAKYLGGKRARARQKERKEIL